MSYLTDDQVTVLLRDIQPHRVKQVQGLSHVEAWDIRAHLNRVFGFARWSADTIESRLLYADTTETKAGRSAVKVAFLATCRLTIHAPDGTTLATYTESAVGESTMPDFKKGDAFDTSVKTAESQAFKRAAANLGTQFGLSLYDDGSLRDVVQVVVGRVAPEMPGTPVE